MDEKNKTDGYFVTTMLAIGLLGLVVFYHSRILSIVWEKADRNQLNLELLMIEHDFQKQEHKH